MDKALGNMETAYQAETAALVGSADFKDHWDDIAGYAKITSERL